MRSEWKLIGLGVALVMAASQNVRAQDGRPSQSTLDQMGLSGLTVMSDSDGMSVRGHGYHGGGSKGSSVQVFGNSFATITTPFGDAHSENGYAVSGKHKASGGNGSWAGVEIKTSGGKPGHGSGGGYPKHGGGGYGGGKPTVTSIKVFAGGYSHGSAW